MLLSRVFLSQTTMALPQLEAIMNADAIVRSSLAQRNLINFMAFVHALSYLLAVFQRNNYHEQYVRDMVFDTKVEILALHKICHADSVMTSYKLTIWRDDEDKLMQPGAWPQFISYRRFITRGSCDHGGGDVFNGFSQQARDMLKDNDDEVSPHCNWAHDY